MTAFKVAVLKRNITLATTIMLIRKCLLILIRIFLAILICYHFAAPMNSIVNNTSSFPTDPIKAITGALILNST